jgi:RNA polymerase sigma-70 factor (ECF subfamily)
MTATLLTETTLRREAPSLARRRAAFDRLVEPHVPALRRTALYMTGRADRADEALQETYLKVWRALETYDPSREARVWLFAILRRAIFDAGRRRRRDARVASLDEARPEGVPGREEGALSRLFRGEVSAAIARLPGEFRDVVRLVVLEEKSYRDAASELAIPVGTVMSRLHRGRRILQDRLRDYAPEGTPARRTPAALTRPLAA